MVLYRPGEKTNQQAHPKNTTQTCTNCGYVMSGKQKTHT